MQAKQIMLIAGVCLLMAGLLSMDIHKAGKPAEKNSQNVKSNRASSNESTGISESDLIKKGIAALSAVQKKAFSHLDELNKNGDVQSSLNLSAFWLKAGNPGLSAIFKVHSNELILKKGGKNVASDWVIAGDQFRKAFISTGDSVQQALSMNFYAGKAKLAYQNALALEPSNLMAQTGLGVCYVTASENPMQGISLLLGVVKKEPENLAANFNLGLFSMRSGQYDKAIGRFKTVVKKENNGEAWFYLGQAYQQTGKKAEANNAYINSKKYISDTSARSSIDHLIEQTK